MAPRPGLIKITDYEGRFWCGSGVGILREEVWVDQDQRVVRYNLAFIVPHVQAGDRGRMLGYDNAHGSHERHFRGHVSPFDFKNYPATARLFFREVDALRRKL